MVLNFDHGVEEEIIEVGGHPIKKYYRVFDNKRLWKVLNRLKKIEYTDKITEFDVVEWGHCIANATIKYDKDYIEESVNFFTTIEKINEDHQKKLFLSLMLMVKFIFSDDIEKTRELLTMITLALPSAAVKPLVTDEDYIEAIEEAEYRIKRYKLEVSSRDSIIENYKSEIDKKDSMIENYKSEVEDYKSMLDDNYSIVDFFKFKLKNFLFRNKNP